MTGRTGVPALVSDPERFFLQKFDLAEHELERVVGGALLGSVDDAELYFEYTVHESVSLEEGIVKRTTHSTSQGVGVRVLSGDRTGYAYSEEISLAQLQSAARAAQAIAQSAGAQEPVGLVRRHAPHDLYPVTAPATGVHLAEKLALLSRIDQAGRGYDPRIHNVLATLASEQKVVLIVRADGTVVGDVRPLVRMSVSCIAEQGQNRQTGRSGGGGRIGWSTFLDAEGWRGWVEDAARQAVLNLGAVDAPAGTMDVVLCSGWPGILLHEAVGHGLEGDFNRKGSSAFSGRIGQRVASELCTIVDDGTLPSRRGSLNVDDEGTPTQCNVLIERGILRGYMNDRMNARLLGHEPTGNGRRESYAHVPLPRMTNTFMLAGDDDPAEMIRGVRRGLYAVSFGGGQVDITSGRFVFSASEAYLIEDGQVTAPVRGATLIGNGPDVLTRVSAVGNDLRLDEGIGTCGKAGQGVPVGVGMPSIRIDWITVGGTAGA